MLHLRPAAATAETGHPSAARRSLPLTRTDIVACTIFLGCALLLFRLSLFEGWAFIGDSDRLNSALNVRAFEVMSLLQRGSVPTWSDQQFMGNAIIGMHWLLAGAPPVPQLLALLPASELYHALAWLAALMLACAMAAAYWLLGMYTANPLQRIVGALLYGTGSYLFHKLTQLDIAYVSIIATPILVGLVHRTRRDNMVWTFLGMLACWTFLVVCTVLQEIAYIGLLWGTYALFRSVRLRDPWPVLVAGLAFGCGVIFGAPRILTIAAEIPLVTRTSSNIGTTAIEALRYFGDGLVGRSQGEQDSLRGASINTHEGVQLLSSALAALGVIAFGLLSPSRSLRLWGVALVVIVSVGLNAYFRPFYELESLGLKGATYPSRELRTIVINAVLLGTPLWLLAYWAGRRARASEMSVSVPSDTPVTDTASRGDLPFFYGFVVLAFAAILIPEARAVLYYGFMKMDFLHSRISVAMILPLVILATVFLGQFMPSRTTGRERAWIAGGVLIGLVLWLPREAAAEFALQQVGPALDALRPQRLITVEAVRVLSSVLVVLAACAALVCRARRSGLMLMGGVLACWIATESMLMTEHRLNGPQVVGQSRPFSNLDYLQVPPGGMRVPTDIERAAVRERLEADKYRVVLVQDREVFQALPEAHLSAFWDLRLVEGYSTGTPRRLMDLPWPKDIAEPHHLDLNSSHNFGGLPWQLLAALNVKYAVVVDRSFWFNPAPGMQYPPLDLSKLEILENPNPVLPRAFFTARVTPAAETPRLPGDTGRRPTVKDPPVADLVSHSVAETWTAERQFSTAGTLDPTFDSDRVLIRVDAAPEDRFLVLNELYHPTWQARVDGEPATIYPTNLVMRGILVPAGATTIELQFVPFITTPQAGMVVAFGLVVTALVVVAGLRMMRGGAGTTLAKATTAIQLSTVSRQRRLAGRTENNSRPSK